MGSLPLLEWPSLRMTMPLLQSKSSLWAVIFAGVNISMVSFGRTHAVDTFPGARAEQILMCLTTIL